MNKKDIYDKINGSTFCPYFFLHYHIDTNKKNKTCCHSFVLLDGELADFNNGEYNQLRHNSLNEIKSKHCATCYASEEKGVTSQRQKSIIDTLRDGKTDILIDQVEKFTKGESLQPYWYDLRISNNCNLTCQTCGAEASSSWAKKLGLDNTHLSYEPDIDINPDLYRIDLIGGEPFMIKKFIKFVSQIKNKDALVAMNTNGTILNESMIEILKTFNTPPCITVSLDGFGELNDKIRTGSNWRTIEKNIDRLIAEGFSLSVNTVLQKDNVNYLLPLGKFIQEKKMSSWIISQLVDPERFHWTHYDGKIDVEPLKEILEMPEVQKHANSVSIVKHIINDTLGKGYH